MVRSLFFLLLPGVKSHIYIYTVRNPRKEEKEKRIKERNGAEATLSRLLWSETLHSKKSSLSPSKAFDPLVRNLEVPHAPRPRTGIPRFRQTGTCTCTYVRFSWAHVVDKDDSYPPTNRTDQMGCKLNPICACFSPWSENVYGMGKNKCRES